jgi:hypothetical protein
MADVTFRRSAGLLDAYGRQIPASDFCRLNRDNTGPRSIPDGLPYVPQGFPVGTWKITAVEQTARPHLSPVAIHTTAWRMVPVWDVDPNGVFVRATGRWVRDFGYEVHFSDLDFTDGCVRVVALEDMQWLAGKVQSEIDELRNLNPAEAWVSLEVV